MELDLTSYLLGSSRSGGGGSAVSPTAYVTQEGDITTITITDVHGTTTATIDLSDKQDTFQFSTMPTPSADTVGKVVQYIGSTGAYKTGYFYIGTTDDEPTPTYSWVEVKFGSDISTITYLPSDVGTQANPFIFDEHDTGLYITGLKSLNSTFYMKGKSTDANAVNIFLPKGIILIDYKIDLKDYTSGTSWFADIYTGLPSYQNRTIFMLKYDGTLDASSTNTQTYLLANETATISKKFTYSVLPESSVTPTTNDQLTNKAYVDSVAGGSSGGVIITDSNKNQAATLTALTAEYNKFLNNQPYSVSYYTNLGIPGITINSCIPLYFTVNPSFNTVVLISDYIRLDHNLSGAFISCFVSKTLTISNGEITGYNREDKYSYNIPRTSGIIMTQNNTISYTPSNDYNPATKKYVDDLLKGFTNYDSTKTQVLKNVNGTFTWVDE